MWIMLVMGSYWIYMSLGGAIRGKWRMSDRMGDSGMDRKFGAPMVVAPACVD
jgi:hypothetical protein